MLNLDERRCDRIGDELSPVRQNLVSVNFAKQSELLKFSTFVRPPIQFDRRDPAPGPKAERNPFPPLYFFGQIFG